MIFLLWAIFLIGWLAVLVKHAYKSAANQFTPWDNIGDYCKIHAPDIMLNLLLSCGLFWGVWRDTSFITKTLLMFGVHKDIEVALNPFTAACYGVVSQQIADIFTSFIIAIAAKLKDILPSGGNDEPKP